MMDKLVKTVKYNGNMAHLYNDDCLKVMDYLISKNIKVDAIITDPPYGATACKWDSAIVLEKMWKQLKLLRKDNTPIILFGSEPFSSYLRISNIKEYKYDWVYVKSQATNFLNAKKQPLRNNENILVFYNKQCKYNPQMKKGKPYICKSGKQSESVSSDKNITKGGYVTINNGERYPLSVMDCYNSETGLHPTQKPVALMEYLIRTYTNEGDTVLDFTMGSGTVGVACIKTNRNFIGIEFNPEKDKEGNLVEPAKYFNIAVDRIIKESEK